MRKRMRFDRLQFYTVDAVAEQLGVSTKTVRRWITAGDLPAHRLGRQLRISNADLATFIAQRRRP
jgi:excisionase family DNA binding protein